MKKPDDISSVMKSSSSLNLNIKQNHQECSLKQLVLKPKPNFDFSDAEYHLVIHRRRCFFV